MAWVSWRVFSLPLTVRAVTLARTGESPAGASSLGAGGLFAYSFPHRATILLSIHAIDALLTGVPDASDNRRLV